MQGFTEGRFGLRSQVDDRGPERRLAEPVESLGDVVGGIQQECGLAAPFDLPIKLGDVGEFWLFFLSIATFTTHVIMAERQRLRKRGDANRD